MSRREAVNTSFYNLWFDLTGNRTRVYRFSGRRSIHSTSNLLNHATNPKSFFAYISKGSMPKSFDWKLTDFDERRSSTRLVRKTCTSNFYSHYVNTAILFLKTWLQTCMPSMFWSRSSNRETWHRCHMKMVYDRMSHCLSTIKKLSAALREQILAKIRLSGIFCLEKKKRKKQRLLRLF